MKFNGQSSVEVQPHSDVDELKTVTSISLFIRVDPDKDPIEDRFILYLGDRSVSGRGGGRWREAGLTGKNKQQECHVGAIMSLNKSTGVFCVGVWSPTPRSRSKMRRPSESLWRVNVFVVAICGGGAIGKGTFKVM